MYIHESHTSVQLETIPWKEDHHLEFLAFCLSIVQSLYIIVQRSCSAFGSDIDCWIDRSNWSRCQMVCGFTSSHPAFPINPGSSNLKYKNSISVSWGKCWHDPAWIIMALVWIGLVVAASLNLLLVLTPTESQGDYTHFKRMKPKLIQRLWRDFYVRAIH